MTVQFSGRWDALRQDAQLPVAISRACSRSRAPTTSATTTRRRWAQSSREPTAGASPSTRRRRSSGTASRRCSAPILRSRQTSDNTSYIGLASRVMLPKTTYIALEYTPADHRFLTGSGDVGRRHREAHPRSPVPTELHQQLWHDVRTTRQGRRPQQRLSGFQHRTKVLNRSGRIQ